MYRRFGPQGAVINFGKVVSVIGSVANPDATVKEDEDGNTTADEDEVDLPPNASRAA
jgi:rRNA processing protein Gar1